MYSNSLIDFTVIKKTKHKYLQHKHKFSLRKSPAYEAWRKKVLARDRYICQNCGRVNVRFQVHHIRGFTKYPHLRLDVNNGITYCNKCHRRFHNKYGKQNFPDSRTVEF